MSEHFRINGGIVDEETYEHLQRISSRYDQSKNPPLSDEQKVELSRFGVITGIHTVYFVTVGTLACVLGHQPEYHEVSSNLQVAAAGSIASIAACMYFINVGRRTTPT